MEVRPVTPDAGAQPGELSPADGPGPRGLPRYRSAQGRWVVAEMTLASSVAGIDSTVVAVALPAIGRNRHAGFQGLQWTVTSYTLTLASLILLAGSLSDRWGRRRVFAQISWICAAAFACAAVLAATLITGSRHPTPARQAALVQTPVPHLACPVAVGHAPGQTPTPDSSQTSNRSRAPDTPSPTPPPLH